MMDVFSLVIILGILGLIVLFLGASEASRQRGLNLFRASFYLSLYLAHVATSNYLIFYIFSAACILDIFISILYFEKKKEEGIQR